MVGVADDEAALLEAPNAVVAVGEAATSVAAVALGEPRGGRRAARWQAGRVVLIDVVAALEVDFWERHRAIRSHCLCAACRLTYLRDG